MKKTLIIILLFTTNFIAFTQDFVFSNFAFSTSSLSESISQVKVGNELYILGDYLGTLELDKSYIGNSKDIYLVNYKQSYEIDWSRQIGGAGIDFANDIVSDGTYLYLLGGFQSDLNFGATTLNSEGFLDIFLAKYDLNGNEVWAKKIAYNEGKQFASSIDIDKNGDLIVAGYYRDSVTFETESFVNTFGIFITKLDQNGNVLWVNNIPTNSASSKITDLKAFENGYYFNGNFTGTLSLDLGVKTSSGGIYTDIFIYKTDYSGADQWFRQSYTDDDVYTGTITQDEYGNIYFTGSFDGSQISVDSTLTTKSANLINQGGSDIFIYKYNKSGNLIWGESYGGLYNEWARGINFDNNAIYITGYFADEIVFGIDTLRSTSLSDYDLFLGMIDRDGNHMKAISVSGPDSYGDSGIELETDEEFVYLAGYFRESQVTVGSSVYINPNPSNLCLLVAKYKPSFISVFTEYQNVTCNGQIDGELIVTPYFGTAPYTYSWSHNASLTDSTATGLAPGTYTVTVTDALASTAEASYTLTEPDPISFNPSITLVTQCSYTEEGVIDLNMAGGNSGYTYRWQASEGGSGVAFSAEDQSGLTVGTYKVTVTDSKECTADTTMLITGPDPVTFGGSVVTDSSSIGSGAIDLSFAGGFGAPASFTFDWQGPYAFSETTEDVINLNTGNYEVTVTDVHLCEFDTSFNIANLDTFYVFISQHKDACQGTINGTATVDFYSPDSHTAITYLWDVNAGNQTTAKATSLAPGQYYYVTVTDTENSPNTILVDSVYIDQLPYTFAGSISGTSTLGCFGDTDGYIDLSITTSGTKPYVYNWSTGSTLQDLTNLGPGNYSVTVTDKYSCTFSITNYPIDQPTILSAVAEIVTKPTCNGDFDGEITVDRSGGTSPYKYQWDDPGFQDTRNADGLDAGYYSITVTDVNGCNATSSINLSQPGLINATKLITNEICNSAGEAAISLTVTGGTAPFSYSWSTVSGTGLIPSDKNQSGLTAAKYYFTATDDHNCAFKDSAELTEPPLLQITNEEKTNVSACNGENTGTITITAIGGTGVLTYTLNPGAIQTNNTGYFTGLGAGNYTVNVEDENACSVTSGTLAITEPGEIVITKNQINNLTCNGTTDGSISITVSGGTIASNYTYTWSTTDGSGLVNGIEDQPTVGAGAYYLTVTDDYLCEATANFTLTEPDTILISKTVYNPSCNDENDGVVVISHSGGVLPFSYFWSTTDGSGLEPVNRNQGGLSSGTYTLELTDAIGCVVVDQTLLTAPLEISIDSENVTDATGSKEPDGAITVVASGGTGVLTYTLLPGNKVNQTGIFSSLLPGDYTVNVRDENYCGPVSSATITIGFPEGLEDIFENDFIKIYPNPTSDNIFIEMDYSGDDLDIQLISISGQVLFNGEIKAQGFIKKEIDLSNYPKGIYFIQVFNNKIYFNNKILLQ